jgi:tetrahydrodipicolinate N-succinyltransferase|tara:strand:+ start:1164 stop:1619 length:456 start_codon:yes stop_codon:yes gene_type:complete
MTNYDPIDEALNVKSEIIPTPEDVVSKKKNQIKKVEGQDVGKDYDYTRGNLYSLIEKGQEAINGIMEVAGETASPRAYEVAGQLIKSVADTTDKLMDLQKKVKEVDEDNNKTTNNVTNNALFVGSTSELSKMLKQGILNNKEESTRKNEKV